MSNQDQDQDQDLQFNTAPDVHDVAHYFNPTNAPPRPLPQRIPYNRTMTKPPENYDAICPHCSRLLKKIHKIKQGKCTLQYFCKPGCGKRTRLVNIKQFRLKRNHTNYVPDPTSTPTRTPTRIRHTSNSNGIRNSNNSNSTNTTTPTPTCNSQRRRQPASITPARRPPSQLGTTRSHSNSRPRRRLPAWVTNSDLFQYRVYTHNPTTLQSVPADHLPDDECHTTQSSTSTPTHQRACKACGHTFRKQYQRLPNHRSGSYVCNNCKHTSPSFILVPIDHAPTNDHVRARLEATPTTTKTADIFFMQTYCNDHVSKLLSKDLLHRPSVTAAFNENPTTATATTPTDHNDDDNDSANHNSTPRPRFGYRWGPTIERQCYNASAFAKKIDISPIISTLANGHPYVDTSKPTPTCYCHFIPDKFKCKTKSNAHFGHLLTMDPECLQYLAKPLLARFNTTLKKLDDELDPATEPELKDRLKIWSSLLSIGLHHRPRRTANATNLLDTCKFVLNSFLDLRYRYKS